MKLDVNSQREAKMTGQHPMESSLVQLDLLMATTRWWGGEDLRWWQGGEEQGGTDLTERKMGGELLWRGLGGERAELLYLDIPGRRSRRR